MSETNHNRINNMMTAAERETKEKAARKAGFAKWMDQPATRMMMSMIPTGEKPEVLETLLQETFNAGFNSGSGDMAGSFLEVMLRDIGKHKDRP